VIKLKK